MNERITEYWHAIALQDKEWLRAFFHQDAVIRWHNTNEQFTLEEFLTANCDYPGRWNSEVKRIDFIEHTIITVTRIWSKDSNVSFHAISFFETDGSKIRFLDEYWSEDGDAPQWRLDKRIGVPIH